MDGVWHGYEVRTDRACGRGCSKSVRPRDRMRWMAVARCRSPITRVGIGPRGWVDGAPVAVVETGSGPSPFPVYYTRPSVRENRRRLPPASRLRLRRHPMRRERLQPRIGPGIRHPAMRPSRDKGPHDLVRALDAAGKNTATRTRQLPGPARAPEPTITILLSGGTKTKRKRTCRRPASGTGTRPGPRAACPRTAPGTRPRASPPAPRRRRTGRRGRCATRRRGSPPARRGRRGRATRGGGCPAR